MTGKCCTIPFKIKYTIMIPGAVHAILIISDEADLLSRQRNYADNPVMTDA